MLSHPTSPRQVALLIESSRAYGRGLLNGIAAYAQEQGNWSLRHQEMVINADPPEWLADWNGDGILVRAETPAMIDAIRRSGIPAIDLRCLIESDFMPGMDTDGVSVVRLAVDHLRDRGFTRFGFCGFGGANYSERRLEEMQKYVADLGYSLVSYQSAGATQATTFGAEQAGMLDQKGLTRWLSTLDHPIGVLACNDIRAQQLLNACHATKLDVPDQVAVVGVDNDDVICPLCLPPLTSVEPDTHRIGYEAAAMLEEMMNGKRVKPGIKWVPARRIVVRRSTDAIPVDDAEFVIAYRYIRENACRGISVQDVADAVPMSRRALERRMRTYFDQSPADVIAAFRLERIKELLENTSRPLKQIAKLTGFDHVEHMAKFFKKLVGIPAGQYRTKHRLASQVDPQQNADPS
ncbi:AraC family transcriptional regulator [Rhodopirellula sallentina]|uniref:Xylose operon regulatory protein n=1 Tax=Rhodopirellula sallentina SM41 TaxID=1263870 RepID=M5UAU9_9BACT|nr:XylR family transcriptional regulator [Rhodopirellula sallentina]EMI54971.1 xylose operon regulatory protein [Rhodopirellula sallentina SM41]